jgi:hypothetical protein
MKAAAAQRDEDQMTALKRTEEDYQRKFDRLDRMEEQLRYSTSARMDEDLIRDYHDLKDELDIIERAEDRVEQWAAIQDLRRDINVNKSKWSTAELYNWLDLLEEQLSNYYNGIKTECPCTPKQSATLLKVRRAGPFITEAVMNVVSKRLGVAPLPPAINYNDHPIGFGSEAPQTVAKPESDLPAVSTVKNNIGPSCSTGNRGNAESWKVVTSKSSVSSAPPQKGTFKKILRTQETTKSTQPSKGSVTSVVTQSPLSTTSPVKQQKQPSSTTSAPSKNRSTKTTWAQKVSSGRKN